ncbi:hypothetical protein N0V93_006046 [Gnomoniopsis smithogilvyi]|uniref:Uncharacterized protein n=1 Tax=Gnomoniopsis smithogilvyi TaxID=1191159 RepID=A0A9W8YQY5_9PEZI|nr:hypothetical protein N0V93_006046 [Gnomoniopsis smithogilvyi]
MQPSTKDLHDKFEPKPDTQALTGNSKETPHGVSKSVDYEPHPDKSVSISPDHKKIMTHILNLYGGSASEEDMQVYDTKSIYDDPFSYCDTRYKIAGQWWGLPIAFASLKTLKTEVVKDSDEEVVFKLRHEYTLKGIGVSKAVDSLVSLGLDQDGKVRYHKDMWNEKDYSHEGLGKVFKKMNGDFLTGITKPPQTL